MGAGAAAEGIQLHEALQTPEPKRSSEDHPSELRLREVPEKISFPAQEEEVLELWERIDAFQTQLKQTEGRPPFTFYDGPPFATGTPHYGHILAGTIKDTITRYWCANGFHVERRFGWDCHGLPIEYEIEKTLGIKTREEVLHLGIRQYNQECRKIVMRYAAEWEKTTGRLGRWIDFKNDYKTMDAPFMESVWWAFKQLHSKGLVYKGFKVMPYSCACATPLSNFEATQNYKEVSDPAVFFSFPLEEEPSVSLVAWTTTPWSLPGNLALCVNPTFVYAKVRDKTPQNLDRVFIVAESRISSLYKKEDDYELIDKVLGSSLVGLSYEPILPYFAHLKGKGAFKICGDGYVTGDVGTGIVQQAPAFGEDDYRVCLANGIITKGQPLLNTVDHHGRMTPDVTDFAGLFVKDADKEIVKKLKAEGRVVAAGTIVHSYPFCWRSDTPLIYKAVPSWFIKVESIKDKLLEHNLSSKWVPEFVQEKRMHNWLKDARDWSISRNRFWGTPLPIWMSEDGLEQVVVGSVEELHELSGVRVADLHREHVDQIVIPSRLGKGDLRRVDEVFDCWFESGSMPYASRHFPFSMPDEEFHTKHPADFVAEGLDQTRGWFYTLLVLSVALFDRPPFKNLICNGLVLAADGKKMSKRLKNYPPPDDVMSEYGADALRLYLVTSPVVRAEALKFSQDGVRDTLKSVFLPWQNAYRFFVQNARRWEYANTQRFYSTGDGFVESKDLMDRWIQADLSRLIVFVRQEMEAYRLYSVTPKLLVFIEDLTNWYVRMNRKRLKGSEGEADAAVALRTLFEVLFAMCGLMAPFCPFLTEAMYQNLKACLPPSVKHYESLHFAPMPKASAEAHDPHIVKQVEWMQAVIELVRQARDRRKLSLKTPLREVTLVQRSTTPNEDIQTLKSYIMEEANVRSVVVVSADLSSFSLSAVTNDSKLGKRLGKALKAVKQAVAAITNEQCRDYQQRGAIDIAGTTLSGDDLRIQLNFRGDIDRYEVCSNQQCDLVVLVDVRMDESLQQEGITREVVNRIQKLRKAAGLKVGDNIRVTFSVADASLNALLTENAKYIGEAIAADFVAAGDGIEGDVIRVSEEELHGTKVALTLLTLPQHL
jgi:isoleucyl-tRNA synthetase